MLDRLRKWWQDLDDELNELTTPPPRNRYQRRHPGVVMGATKFGNGGKTKAIRIH